MDIYKTSYMQIPFDTLTKEKLDRLEKHCKKAIHFERGHIQEEHQTTLDLLYKYYEQESEIEHKDQLIKLMALAILNYDDQLVINRYKDLEHVKETFEEILKEEGEEYE